jgi:hypothetical protein
VLLFCLGYNQLTPEAADAILAEVVSFIVENDQQQEIPLHCSNITKIALQDLDKTSEKTSVFKTRKPCFAETDRSVVKCNLTFENMTPITTRTHTKETVVEIDEEEVGLFPCRLNGTLSVEFVIDSDSRKVANVTIVLYDLKLYNVKGGCCPKTRGQTRVRRNAIKVIKNAYNWYGYYEMAEMAVTAGQYVYDHIDRKLDEYDLYDQLYHDRPQYALPLSTPDCSNSFFCRPDQETIEWRKKSWRIN